MASRLSDDDPLVSRFKALFPDKSLKTLYEIFTDMAQSVYKKQSSASVLSLVSLNLIEFKIAMVKFKSAKLSFEEIRRIFLWLDSDHGNHNGRVEYDEFVAGIRGELPPHLRRMVLYVFRRLDRNMNGYVEEKELAVHLRKAALPDIVDGSRTPQAKAKDLMALVVAGVYGPKPALDGGISLEQLVDHYLTVTLATPMTDEAFQARLHADWGVNPADMNTPGSRTTSVAESTAVVPGGDPGQRAQVAAGIAAKVVGGLGLNAAVAALEASQPLSPAPSTVSPRTAKAVASAALHVPPAASSSASARTPTSPRASQEYKASPMIMMGAGLESPRDRALLGGTSSHEPRPSVGGVTGPRWSPVHAAESPHSPAPYHSNHGGGPASGTSTPKGYHERDLAALTLTSLSADVHATCKAHIVALQGKVGDQQMTITQHLQTIANLQAVIGTQQQMLSQLQGMMQQLQFQHTNAAVHASTAAMLR